MSQSRRPCLFLLCMFPGVLKSFLRTRGHLTDCTDEQAGMSPHCSHISGYAISCDMHHVCSLYMHTLPTWLDTLNRNWGIIESGL